MTTRTNARFRALVNLLPFALFALALGVVHHETKIHDLREIGRSLHTIPAAAVLLAAGMTFLNYILLSGYDLLALRYTGNKGVNVFKVMLASMIGYAISNNTGHSWATGGSIRYRFYTAWGVPGWDIFRISLFLALTYCLGILTLGLAGAVMMPQTLRAHIQDPGMVSWIIAGSALVLTVYWMAVLFWRKQIVFRGLTLSLPSPAITLAQTAIASVDLLMAFIVLWIFLPDSSSVTFETFLIVFVIAQVMGLASQVPGGIGVFEGAFLWLLGGSISAGEHLDIVGALILYRIIYYFVPLGLAGIALLGHEAHARRELLNKGGQRLSRLLSAFTPQAFSLLLIMTGAVLLISGATPSLPENMRWLGRFVPLSLVEISHLVNSLIGLLLLFLARGIYLRLDAAWYGSIIVLSLGIVASFLKGLDWKEASLLMVMLVLLLPAHGYFRRKSSLFNISFSASWLGMLFIVLAGSTWIGFFAFRKVEYADDLWWQFSYLDDAPRFLRSLVLLSVVVTGYALARLLTVAKPDNISLPGAEELDRVARIARAGSDTQGFLALLGDKFIHWSASERSFLMFGTGARHWIVMGDPVGDPAEFEALLWQFKERADLYGAKIAFYETSDKYLPLYLDLGLVPLKIGEKARIELSTFVMTGKKRENQRNARNKFGKLGYSFSLLSEAERQQAMPELRRISDKWLQGKNTREKRFSLGFFDENYIARTRLAVVRSPEGKITAFANLWETDGREEISVDLMRYDEDAPRSIMEFLFVELILAAQAEGFTWFNLGMAPLSGLERRPLAPLWHKIGTVIYDLGEEFYNFDGLYEYKDKFDPVWLPHYVAAPPGPSMPFIMLAIARMIAGGWRGLVFK